MSKFITRVQPLMCGINSNRVTSLSAGTGSAAAVSSYLQDPQRRLCSSKTVKLCPPRPSTPSKTYLYDFHVAQGGKMVNFAGYMMPVQYGALGIADSHRHTRTHCSLFDVSHMVQLTIVGKDRIKFMESLVVGDIEELESDSGTLTLYTNAKGGVHDDLICNKAQEGETLYVVSNAGRRFEDLELLEKQLASFLAQGFEVEVRVLDDDYGLLALQGPEAATVLQPLTKVDLSKLKFMKNAVGDVAGISGCRITRCGYTGEDGVEISVPRNHCVALAQALLASSDGDVRLAGLGARDSLRIEAGLCLYGSDLTEETTPVEATLAWTIGKRRRRDGGFPGAQIILDQLNKKSKPRQRRVGLAAIGSAGRPFRGGAEIVSGDKVVGKVTSGVPSPSLGRNVGMGYVKPEVFKPGTELKVRISKKDVVDVAVSKMPFVPTKYFM